jgi:hypothetical protein
MQMDVKRKELVSKTLPKAVDSFDLIFMNIFIHE